jgi:uncharacterized lipoprotein YmbA
MKNIPVIICYLFVALILAIALTGCSTPIKDCQYYIDNQIDDFTECKFIKPDCTTDSDCESKYGVQY